MFKARVDAQGCVAYLASMPGLVPLSFVEDVAKVQQVEENPLPPLDRLVREAIVCQQLITYRQQKITYWGSKSMTKTYSCLHLPFSGCSLPQLWVIDVFYSTILPSGSQRLVDHAW